MPQRKHKIVRNPWTGKWYLSCPSYCAIADITIVYIREYETFDLARAEFIYHVS